MAVKSEMIPRDQQRLTRTEARYEDPFRALDRFASEMDRIFDSLGFGRSLFPRRVSGWMSPASSPEVSTWMPEIEMYQRNHELVVRADLPGLKKDEVKVDITDQAITIHGERRQEQQNEQGGVYRTERSYGSFYRQIPLPDGAMTDQAKATFKNGVLEITVPSPPDQVTRGRRLDITEGTESRK